MMRGENIYSAYTYERVYIYKKRTRLPISDHVPVSYSGVASDHKTAKTMYYRENRTIVVHTVYIYRYGYIVVQSTQKQSGNKVYWFRYRFHFARRPCKTRIAVRFRVYIGIGVCRGMSVSSGSTADHNNVGVYTVDGKADENNLLTRAS